jgi:decaprenyl-phosphate phosphoribosyltransferase
VAMAVYPRLNDLVLVFPLIVLAVIAYFQHAMKEETARLEPEQLLRNPWVVGCTLVTGGLTLWLLWQNGGYAKAMHLLGPLTF